MICYASPHHYAKTGDENMSLVRPEARHGDAYLDFAREWAGAGEAITPYSARLLSMTYAEWLAHTHRMETEAPDGFVTAHTYFYTGAEGYILGALNLRHTLSDFLLRFGGHIGYGIRPSARRRGHAAAMLAEGLCRARGQGLSRVLLTCDKENIASARTILRNGGVLENEVPEEGRITQRYWIDL